MRENNPLRLAGNTSARGMYCMSRTVACRASACALSN